MYHMSLLSPVMARNVNKHQWRDVILCLYWTYFVKVLCIQQGNWYTVYHLTDGISTVDLIYFTASSILPSKDGYVSCHLNIMGKTHFQLFTHVPKSRLRIGWSLLTLFYVVCKLVEPLSPCYYYLLPKLCFMITFTLCFAQGKKNYFEKKCLYVSFKE